MVDRSQMKLIQDLAKATRSADTLSNQMAIVGDICKLFMGEPIYPEIATRIYSTVLGGDITTGFHLVKIILPEYGCSVGVPLASISTEGYYASVFRRKDKGYACPDWFFTHNGPTDDYHPNDRSYCSSPSIALMAAILHAYAWEQRHEQQTTKSGSNRRAYSND